MKVEKNNTYIKVPHSMFFYDQDVGTEIHKIGTQGFTLWAYLLMLQGRNNILPITIESICKQINIKGLKEKAVVKNILLNLKRLEYIICEELDENTKPKDLMFMEIPKFEEDGFSSISTQLILDHLHKIGHIAFTLYCLMYKEHNQNNGNPESNGYCHKSTNWFADRLGLSRKTVETHIKKLPNKLVKVQEMPPMQTYNVRGELIHTQQPSRYYVHAKYERDNIYYIEHNTQEKKKMR